MIDRPRVILIAFLILTVVLLYLNYLAWFRYSILKSWTDKYERTVERIGFPASGIHFFFGPEAYKWLHRFVLFFMLIIAGSIPVSWLLYRLGLLN